MDEIILVMLEQALELIKEKEEIPNLSEKEKLKDEKIRNHILTAIEILGAKK